MSHSRRPPPPPLPVKDRLTPADWDAAFVKSGGGGGETSADDPFADPGGDEVGFGSWHTSSADGDVDWGEFATAAR